MAQKAHEKKVRRPRGSFPPTLSLPDAVSVITHLYENVGGDASYDTFAGLIENSPSSSTFHRKLAALKNYGLVTDENKHVKVSSLGDVIVAPTSPDERMDALKKAFLSVEIFALLYDKYRGKLLPQDEFLTNVVTGLVPKEFANTWIDRFKQSAKAAGLIRDRGDGKLQVREMAELGSFGTASEGDQFSQTPSVSPSASPSASPSPAPPDDDEDGPTTYGHVSKIKLSEDRQAVFKLPDRLTGRDAQKLKGALQGLATIIDSMVEEQEDDLKTG
jgi:hypothetical protein